MAHIVIESTIYAPVGIVFDAIRKPERRPAWMVNLHEVRNVTGFNVGDSWEYDYKMVGRTFTGKIYFLEIETPHFLKLDITGGITGTQDWYLTPTSDDGTLLRFVFDYTVPGVLLGEMLDKLFIERQNERQMRASIDNLKALAHYEHEQSQARARAVNA